MEQAVKTIQAREGPQNTARAYNNSTSEQLDAFLSCSPFMPLAGMFLETQLNGKDPISLFAAFIIIALNVFGLLVHEWASTALKLQLKLLTLIFNQRGSSISKHEQDLLKTFLHGIHTARKLFNVEAITTTYAVCTKCSAIYCIDDGKHAPKNCSWKQGPKGAPCGAKMLKLVIKDVDGE
jgi:hypothetical protein